mmetsp:Transcript_14254/g.53968  ORF Transcript_14254/g.53968 Transcript_14254/m.53968 type:complete len:268 (+) Transcript_14254:1815-2618(+)
MLRGRGGPVGASQLPGRCVSGKSNRGSVRQGFNVLARGNARAERRVSLVAHCRPSPPWRHSQPGGPAAACRGRHSVVARSRRSRLWLGFRPVSGRERRGGRRSRHPLGPGPRSAAGPRRVSRLCEAKPGRPCRFPGQVGSSAHHSGVPPAGHRRSAAVPRDGSDAVGRRRCKRLRRRLQPCRGGAASGRASSAGQSGAPPGHPHERRGHGDGSRSSSVGNLAARASGHFAPNSPRCSCDGRCGSGLGGQCRCRCRCRCRGISVAGAP